MATQLFLNGDAAGATFADMQRGTNTANLRGSNIGWRCLSLLTTRGNAAVTRTTNTVTGPTAGLEVVSSGTNCFEWLSLPIDQDVTISDTITLNIWANENNMSANVAINAKIERLTSQGDIASTIAQTARTTELGTSAAAENFTVSPTSTAMLKGDRIRVTVYGDDSTSNMATGFTFSVVVGGTTGGASGDTYVQFNETFGFLTSAPAGTQMFLTDAAGPAVGAAIEKEMWTSRGDGVNSIVVNTAAGWTAPIQWTDSGGGTVVEWYSKQLQAFTLANLVRCNLRALESATSANASIRAELAICNSDGSGAAIWAAQDFQSTSLGDWELGTSEAAKVFDIAGDDTAVTDGQRLRLRVYIDDGSDTAMGASQTCTLFYDGTSGGASGDSYITLSQSVTEFAQTSIPPFVQKIPYLVNR